MSIRQVIYTQVKSIAEQQRKSLPPLNDDLGMLESGLDSLCVAILIANLDDELDLNPFDSDNVDIPVTYGDLIRIYEHAAA
jgi:acyl carrier protein